MLTVVGLCSQSDSGNLGHEIYMSLAMANSVLELWEWRMDSQQGLIRLLVGRPAATRLGLYEFCEQHKPRSAR